MGNILILIIFEFWFSLSKNFWFFFLIKFSLWIYFWFLIFVYNPFARRINTIGNDWALLVYLFLIFDFCLEEFSFKIQFISTRISWISKCLCPINNVIIIVDGNCCCWMMMMMVDYHKNIIIIGRMVGHFFWFFKIFQFFDFWFSVVQRCLQERKKWQKRWCCWKNVDQKKNCGRSFWKNKVGLTITKTKKAWTNSFITILDFGRSFQNFILLQARNSKQKPTTTTISFFAILLSDRKKFFQQKWKTFVCPSDRSTRQTLAAYFVWCLG